MDFALSGQQRALVEAVRSFLQRDCPRSVVRELDEQEGFPFKHWATIAKIGLLGAPFPPEYGGSGGTIMDEVLITEELSRGFTALAFAYLVTVSFGGLSIYKFGTEEQRRHHLPKLSRGTRYCLALTEPGGGTDILGSLQTSARRDGDDYVLNGQKVYCTGAHVSDHIIVLARTDAAPARRSEGFTMFLVDNPSPGLEVRPMKKLGLKAVASCEVWMNDVVVPASNIVGELNQGWYHIIETLNNERIEIAALCLGIGQAALDDALAYAKQRQAFGKSIGQFQAIQHQLADSYVELELARMMVYKAASLQASGESSAVEAAMAKLVASEAAMRGADRGMEIMAGSAYMMETDMQRYWRDARLFTFAPITNEMVRNFVGQSLGLPKSY
ncbi:MAG: acyl-CoA dehydrogenase family protein [Dehalococcoidia bacterium]